MGREFIDLFEEWAIDYDKSVVGEDPQYREVFSNYEQILDAVVGESSGTVAEFGVGTGNLTIKLLKAGHNVFAIEPSKAMREIAKKKIPSLSIIDGDFLDYPTFAEQIDTIVSTYAFHHLTDNEKKTAINKFAALLPSTGKIIFADTMFRTVKDKQKKIAEAIRKSHHDLADDLQREYYPTIDTMKNTFETSNFDVSFRQMNDFVWIIIASKK
ncbi:class I SAM-dependent methyltransferase [Oceanobacillus massiliensis]|uniref:class I SAM-dependent methyltransferase n=1 Tax=Oceanobacillus massiliensis TaxID=1465765 RepID=UPI000287B5CC|nr:class I SAM-dependent methyltransferase [Oceanobacillus massiliensis]